MQNKISILVVNYNTEQYIINLLNDLCLQSMSQNQIEVIITNNVQNNKLQQIINSNQLGLKLNITVIPSNKNIGFGRAMNLAAQYASAEHLLVINPDINISNTQFLKQLLDKVETNLDYGIISTKILSGKKGYKTEYQRYEFGHTLGYDDQVCWISGALMLIRTEVFRTVGGFDPDFFMYCEDEDLSYRIKKLSLDLISFSDLEVFHLGGVSEPNHDHGFYKRWYRSKLLFAYKHFSEQQFNQVLFNLEQKSTAKLKKYRRFKWFYFKSYPIKIIKWQVILELISRIKTDGPDWLYFRI